jgi:hypothetical protein
VALEHLLLDGVMYQLLRYLCLTEGGRLRVFRWRQSLTGGPSSLGATGSSISFGAP